MNGEAEAKANVRARAAAIFMMATAMSLGKSGIFLDLSLENPVMIEMMIEQTKARADMRMFITS